MPVNSRFVDMDPITAIGLIASMVQLIDSMTSALQHLNKIKNAPDSRAKLSLERTALLVRLARLRFQLEDCKRNGSWFAALRFLGVANRPLEQLKHTMEEIMVKLDAGQRPQRVKRAVLWCYTKKDIDDLFSRIARLTALINLASTRPLVR
jgi:hypothetical protein